MNFIVEMYVTAVEPEISEPIFREIKLIDSKITKEH